MIQLLQGDCLELMPTLPAASVDLVLCDLPYGTTQNKWDTIIDLEELWAAYRRVCMPTATIVLTAAQPFTSVLVMSNAHSFKYSWVWRKDAGTGFLNAKKQPLRDAEDVLVFWYGKQTLYVPQMRKGHKPYKQVQGKTKSGNYGTQSGAVSESSGERYPLTVLDFKRDAGKEHPTQKPVALMEYLIKTYTNPGSIVLDNCMGSGTTGVACVNTGRSFIGIEKDPKYFAIAERRIAEAEKAGRLFNEG